MPHAIAEHADGAEATCFHRPTDHSHLLRRFAARVKLRKEQHKHMLEVREHCQILVDADQQITTLDARRLLKIEFLL
jgi:hypothetical protein